MILLQRPEADQSFGLITVYVDPAYREQVEQVMHAAQVRLRYGTLSLGDDVPPDGSQLLLVASRYNLANIGRGGATLFVSLSQIGDVADDLNRLSKIADGEISDVTDATIGDKTIDAPVQMPERFDESRLNLAGLCSQSALCSKGVASFFERNSYNDSLDDSLEESVDVLRQQISGLLAQLMRTAKKAGMTNAEVMELFKRELSGKLVLTEKGLSRLTVNGKDEIILPDYNEMEILKGRGIQKMMYYFFLLHPEGVRLSEFGAHIDEFERIYSHLWPVKVPMKEKLLKSVTTGALSYISKLNSRIQTLFPAWTDNPYLVKKDARTEIGRAHV